MKCCAVRRQEANEARGKEGPGRVWRARKEKGKGQRDEDSEQAFDWNFSSVQMSFNHQLSTEIQYSRKNNHCHPFNPPTPLIFKIPLASNGLTAFPPNMPKKNTATRLPSSRRVYHVDKVYMLPGMYPASHKPRKAREMRKPVLFLTKTCSVATSPKMRTWVESHLRGPICVMSVSGAVNPVRRGG